MDFLAFLVPKLRPKCHRLIREILTPTAFLKYLEFLAITLDPEVLESRSRTLKTRIRA